MSFMVAFSGAVVTFQRRMLRHLAVRRRGRLCGSLKSLLRNPQAINTVFADGVIGVAPCVVPVARLSCSALLHRRSGHAGWPRTALRDHPSATTHNEEDQIDEQNLYRRMRLRRYSLRLRR
jgi:hypothetical protein